MMEETIEIRPGRRLHLTTFPNPTSSTALFLIHGLGGRSEQWREQIAILKPHYTLIIPDLLGHGQSDKPFSREKNLYSFDEFEQDLQALFARYSLDDNIIIGHSYGGALASSLALDHQDKVSKLILISPAPCSPNIQIPFFVHLPVFIIQWLQPRLTRQFVHFAFTDRTDPTVVETEINASNRNSIPVIKQMILGMRTIPCTDFTMLTLPTLIILGKHDGIVPCLISEEFYKVMPHHQIVMLDDVAHVAMLEKPAEINSLMMTFLSQST